MSRYNYILFFFYEFNVCVFVVNGGRNIDVLMIVFGCFFLLKKIVVFDFLVFVYIFVIVKGEIL